MREDIENQAALQPSADALLQERIQKEAEAFAAAKELSTPHGWAHYFRQFPEGANMQLALVEEHKTLMLELAYLAADWGKVENDITVSSSLAAAFEKRIGLDRSDGLVVQALLRRKGYYKEALDGVLGEGSRSAIRSFQEDHNIEPTGIVTRATSELLGAGLGELYLQPAASSVRQHRLRFAQAELLQMDQRLQEWVRNAPGVEKLVYGFRDGHLYVASTAPTMKYYYDRLSPSEREIAYLVSLSGSDESRYIYDLVRHDREFWVFDANGNHHRGPGIGLRKSPDAEDQRGDWSWDSGEISNFRNWGRAQPDNYQGREKYVRLWIHGRRYSKSPDLSEGARWNDVSNLRGPLILEFE